MLCYSVVIIALYASRLFTLFVNSMADRIVDDCTLGRWTVKGHACHS